MTEQHSKATLVRTSEKLDAVTKPIRNLAWLLGLITAAWVQFLGPGLVSLLREASGSNELYTTMLDGFEAQSDRLDFIEANITPPKVAIWNFDRQMGLCNDSMCRVLHNISRTPYGAECGIPTATAEIKIGETGQRFDLPFGDGFEETEATIGGKNIIVPFVLQDYIPDGEHEYRFTNVYPTCQWSREPIPRQSPWFKLIVSR